MADPQPPEASVNGAAAAAAAAENIAPGPGSKRQRRPSVRLGDIGDQPAAVPEPYVRRTKPWKIPSLADLRPRHPPPRDSAGKLLSKTRPLTNLRPDDPRKALDIRIPPPSSAAVEDRALAPVDDNLEPPAIGIRRLSREGKARRGGGAMAVAVRRVRTNWALKVDEGTEGAELKSSGGEDGGDEGYVDDSESPSDRNDERAAARATVPESRDFGPDADAMEGDVPSETDNRDWNNRNGECRQLQDGGVRSWLDRLGLGRYAPLFEIHEVDDEVLPLLTLEDLKDMGINAVGSRRKMYCAIEMLRKNTA